ncbi:DUF4446 family protein [Miniphocaeibacter massiliensis]|uniref:DUF4446 family protein n=1 Tax=Miniphocaeibacter massiliensis TaxID=2041841 RepID=UPI000C1C3C87|nr:DUF4446 family protein [Miniphocaeibacter massiliensis]
MEALKSVVQTFSFLLFIILTILMIVAFSKILQVNRKVNRLKKRYDNILNGRGELNIEEVLLAHTEEIEAIRGDLGKISGEQTRLNKNLAYSLQKVGFHKYDAFPDLSNKLSYTLVLLDSFDNGIMITSIYGRENSLSFSKRIEKGIAKMDISDDEKIALNRALSTDK